MAKNKNKGSRVYKRIDLVGVSSKSFEDAIQNAVSKANQTLKGLSWFEVKELRGSINNGRVDQYQAVMVISFEII
jgi:flavin-binding protein dodecin